MKAQRMTLRRFVAEVRPADRPFDDLAWQLWVEEPGYMERLVADLRAHGQQRPVVIGAGDDGETELWDGHHRVTALLHLGRTFVRYVRWEDLSEDEQQDRMVSDMDDAERAGRL